MVIRLSFCTCTFVFYGVVLEVVFTRLVMTQNAITASAEKKNGWMTFWQSKRRVKRIDPANL